MPHRGCEPAVQAASARVRAAGECAGLSPTPCGRAGAGCLGEPGTTISPWGILLSPSSQPLARDGTPLPGARGLGPASSDSNQTFLGPTGLFFPDPQSLLTTVNVTSPDALPRINGTPVALGRGGYADSNGLYFDYTGTPPRLLRSADARLRAPCKLMHIIK
jgi:hypothetical protein